MRYSDGVSFLIVALCFFLSVTASSQNPSLPVLPSPSPTTGVQPYGSFDGGPDVVNLGDLNVHWAFPVVHKVGREMAFDLSLSYDSLNVWSGVDSKYWTNVGAYGWAGVGPGGTGGFLSFSEASWGGNPAGSCTVPGGYPAGLMSYDYIYTDSQGNQHLFGNGTYGAYVQQCESQAVQVVGFPAMAADGSGITLQCNGCGVGSNVGFTVVLPSGQTINSALSDIGGGPTTTSIFDTNGNYITSNGGAMFAGPDLGSVNEIPTGVNNYNPNVPTGLPAYTDTLGSSLMVTTAEGFYDEYNYPTSGYYATGEPDGKQDGTGTIEDANITLSFPGLGFNYTITNSPSELASSFGCPGIAESDSGPVVLTGSNWNYTNLVTNLKMQDGTSYSLSYQPTKAGSTSVTGLLSSVVFPHGGSITYSYGPVNCADGTPLSLTRTVNDGNGHTSQWTYQRSYLSASSQWQTIVTDPNHNQTVHLFVTGIAGAIPGVSSGVIDYYEVSKIAYSGSASSGVVLESTSTCYNGNATGSYLTNCTTPLPFTYPVTSLQTAVTPNGGSLTGATVQLFNNLGLSTESDVYDYGKVSGQVGGLISRTTTTYATAGQILNKPSAITQYDGSGKLLSSTTYKYDETEVLASFEVPNHSDYVQNGVPGQYTTIANSDRGNLTTITRGVGNATLTSHFAYYDTGQVAIATDDNGTTLGYGYSQCGNSLLGSITQTMPPSGAFSGVITLSTESWNCDGAVVVSATDTNGNTTTMNYVDPFWRPTISVDPAGNTTTMKYPTASSNTSTVTKTYAGGLPSSSSLTTYDGLGRTILTQVQQGPGSSTYSSSAQYYDPFGHVAWSSVPYSASAGSYVTTGLGTKAVFDALGRPQIVTDAGGGTLSYTYNLNDTTVTQGPAASSENTKSRQLEYNVAGQLTSVCEITAGLTTSPSGSCGQSSPSTGYLTTYKYSGGLLTNVSQNVQAGPSATQTRSISYDVLGRKTAETIPETGTSTFFYDAASPCPNSSIGDLVKSIDNAGNVTCMAYDGIHRLISSQVVSGPYASVTPQTTYTYYDFGLVGQIGTVVESQTSLCPASGCIATDVYQENYYETVGGQGSQKTGRIVSELFESTPHSNGYVRTESISNANGTPASLSAYSPLGASVGFPNMAYGLDSLGRPANATDTTNNVTLLSGTTYNPLTGAVTQLTYGNGDFDQFGFDPNTGRPTSFAYSIGGPNSFAISGGLTWNPNGSLQNFQMTDTGDPTKNQNCGYTMDDINRLASVSCAGSWAQNFSYDPFGNINKYAPSNATPTQWTSGYMAGYSSINNQVVSGVKAAYDANGNQTVAQVNNLSWNAAAQPVTVNGVGAVYDGLGRVVETDSSNITPGTDTGSTGSIAIGGSEQTRPASNPYQATGTVLIYGTEQSMPVDLLTTSPNGCIPVITDTPADATCYDAGGGILIVITLQASNGAEVGYSTFNYSYGPGDTAATVGARLAAQINADTAAGFSAQPIPITGAPVDVILLQLQSSNSSPVLYFVEAGYGCGGAFAYCSFSLNTPGELTPYTGGGYVPAAYDMGTVSTTINNGPVASYAWGPADTAASIATNLSAAVNQVYGPSGTNIVTAVPVTPVAPAGQASVQLTSIGVGTATNYPVTTSVTYNSADFSSPSFTATTSGMTGGYYSPPVTTTAQTQYVYSPSGAKIAILQGGQLVKGTVPLPGGGTAVYNAGGFNYFRHKDWLGSSRLATTWSHNVYSKEAYAPFGETEDNMEVKTPNTTPDRSFTGQDQDMTSGIFDYLFRRYDPVSGRWLSPDPSGWQVTSLTNPQSFNRYAYVLNNPMSLIDPNGLQCVWSDGSYDSADDPSTGTVGGCQGEGGTWIELGSGYSQENDNPNDSLKNAVQNIQDGTWQAVSVTGVDGAPNITEYNDAGLVTLTDTGGSIVNYDGSIAGNQVGGWETDSGYAAQLTAPNNDSGMAYDIFHCPSCVNTWKQSNCVVSQPWINAAYAVLVGAPAAAIQGGTNNVNGDFLEGAWTAVKEGTASAGAAAAFYGTGIFLTAKYMVMGCPQ